MASSHHVRPCSGNEVVNKQYPWSQGAHTKAGHECLWHIGYWGNTAVREWREMVYSSILCCCNKIPQAGYFIMKFICSWIWWLTGPSSMVLRFGENPWLCHNIAEKEPVLCGRSQAHGWPSFLTSCKLILRINSLPEASISLSQEWCSRDLIIFHSPHLRNILPSQCCYTGDQASSSCTFGAQTTDEVGAVYIGC